MKLQLLLLLSAVVYGAAQTTPSPLTVALNCIDDESADVIDDYIAAVEAAVNGLRQEIENCGILNLPCLTEVAAKIVAAVAAIPLQVLGVAAQLTTGGTGCVTGAISGR
ncbi:hypothetical protein CRE_17339 [Caenorhabditis remanei]|uniref:Uncharacterized protein n=1 Tax=Caenorhabditis remanei TaxID=31234 RepID=E3MRZ7_CAERE|nr:hypothetical protein CRE_17339 [Caenorhabditis remanei]